MSPLYRIKGLDPDNTYLFDAPPAEDKYELVTEKPSKVTKTTDEES